MRKIVVITGLILLLQLVWVSASLAAPPPESDGFWHTVRRGETLFSIGRLYGVSPRALCRANGLSNCNIIRTGQALWIPAYAPAPPACEAFHRVSRGQTLSGIGRYYGVNPWAIAAANKIYNLNRIFVGQVLCIPG
jgi:LysM repeat protein